MTAFQIVLLVVFALLLVFSLLVLAKAWPARKSQALWALLWLGGIVAAIDPNLTTRVAQRLGINRGTDLLLYCAVLFMLVGFFMIYARLRLVRRELTLLVRELALLEAHENTSASDASR